jgi:4-amino-4-deoxy-L-arabinose transferase-like glycosyltransferase
MTERRAEAPAGLRLFLVGAFAAFTAFAGLWTLPPLDRDESRFAQATVQMLETGDFVAIRFQDRERNKKPVGAYWLQAASVSALSDVKEREIWAHRVPSLIGVVLAAIFTFLAGRRLYDQQTGLLAGLLLASAPVVAAEATIAKTDGVLLALVCLAQYALIEIYAAREDGRRKGWAMPIAFWSAQGAATLVKGPIGPMVSALTGAGLIFADRKLKWAFRMRPFIGVLIMAAIVGPWAFAIYQATEGRFFIDAVGGDMLGKIGEAQESHAGPPGYHTLVAWVLFWPAAALLAPGLVHIWRDRRAWQARFLLAWIIPSWIVFEIAATKLPHYVLPMYPALAIVAAQAALKDGRAQTLLRRIGAMAYGGVGVVAAGFIVALPIVLSAGPTTVLYFGLAAGFSVASILIARMFWNGRAYAGGVAAAMLASLYAWTVMGLVLPRLSDLAVSPRISTALELAGRHPLHDGAGPVAFAGYSEPSAVFLLGTDTVLTNGARAGRLFRSGVVSAAAVDASQKAAFVETAGEDFAALAVVDGLNYSNGKSVEITIYVPSEVAP